MFACPYKNLALIKVVANFRISKKYFTKFFVRERENGEILDFLVLWKQKRIFILMQWVFANSVFFQCQGIAAMV